MSKLFSDNPEVLGIIGGMGPMASAYFQRLIVSMTDADVDQQHLPTILLNIPTIPDRTAFLLGKSSESPVPVLRQAAKTLELTGATRFAVTCVTSHCFYDEVAPECGIPWIHAVRETAKLLKESGVKKAGILATSGTVQTGLFQTELQKAGIAWEIPDQEGQQSVMHLIYQNVKAGKPVEMERFDRVVNSLKTAGCEVCILGCTELSLIKRDYQVNGCLDVLEVLARASVLQCGKKLRAEYQNLIAKG